jgi:hypothetical protein
MTNDNGTVEVNTNIAMDYINEARFALDNNDIMTASVILDLLSDIVNPSQLDGIVWEDDDEHACSVRDCDICNPDEAFYSDDCECLSVIGNTCDYCNGDDASPVINSMFWACETCMSTSVV